MEPPSCAALAALSCAESAPWADLPVEAVRRVFELVAEPAAVARAACACSAWRDAAQDECTWQALYAAHWGALPAGSPAATWRERCAGRHALPRACLGALRDCGSPLLRGDALARVVALERAHPSVMFSELQDHLILGPHIQAAKRALTELALETLARVGAAPPDGAEEAQQLLDAACAVSLLLNPRADVAATRAAVARLGRAARSRLDTLGDASPLQRLDALTAFLFGEPGNGELSSSTSLLEPDTPLPGAEAAAGGCGLGRQLGPFNQTRNSSLTVLLCSRGGLPIILAVLHVIVAADAGVPLRPCGVPNQFMTRTPADAPGEPYWVDVFAGGLRRNRAAMLDFISAMGIVPHEHLLAPTAVREVAARMIRNLLHVSGLPGSGARPGLVLHLHSAALSLMPATLDMRLERFRHACDALEVHLAQQDFDALSDPDGELEESMRALPPEDRRRLLATSKQQLDMAYEQAALALEEA